MPRKERPRPDANGVRPANALDRTDYIAKLRPREREIVIAGEAGLLAMSDRLAASWFATLIESGPLLRAIIGGVDRGPSDRNAARADHRAVIRWMAMLDDENYGSRCEYSYESLLNCANVSLQAAKYRGFDVRDVFDLLGDDWNWQLRRRVPQ